MKILQDTHLGTVEWVKIGNHW